MSASPGAAVRRRLPHPVIDADAHWAEPNPIFFEYLDAVVGPAALERFRASYRERARPWYRATPAERQRRRMTRPPFWGLPTHTRDRAAAMIPALFYESLDDWGIDLAIVYPSMGLGLSREVQTPDLVPGVFRAYNQMVADLFRPYADRIIPVGVVSLAEPDEAIHQLEHAHALGLKLVVTGGTVPRTIEEDAAWQPDPRRRRIYLDGLGLDSPYDYDPVWATFTALKMPVISHSGSMGWPDRNAPSNFVANHLGHFAQSHHLFARSLVLGGVTRRFPTLHFGFLEGGVGWACQLYADLLSHWEKRNRTFLHERLKPTNLDFAVLRRLFAQYTADNPHFAGKVEDILAQNLDGIECDISQQELADRDLESDDFVHLGIQQRAELCQLFARNFYFGCEADDPMTAVAFSERLGLQLKPMLGSDISHFDVVDARTVLAEAWELVERGLLTAENFADFTFRNVVRLCGGMNPAFFHGTVVERAAAAVLAGQA